MSEQTTTQTPAQVLTRSPSSDGVLPPPSNNSRIKKYVEQMRYDSTISLARKLIASPMLNAPWGVSASDDAPEGAVDFIDTEVQRLRVRFLQHAVRGMFDYGWAPYEKIFVTRMNNKWGIQELKPLLQRITEILVDKDSGALAGISQASPDSNEEIELDLNECVVLSFDVEGTDWYGTPLMRGAELAYDAWLEAEEGAARYTRKVAGTHWVVHYPLGTSEVNGEEKDNAEIAQDILQALEAAGMVAVPSTLRRIIEGDDLAGSDAAWSVELLSDTGGGTSFTDRQRYLDSLKVRGLGVPERSVTEGQFGTKAEAETHADFAILAIEMNLSWMVTQFNEQVVNHLLRVNWGEQYENTVYVETPRFADAARAIIKEVYMSVLNDMNVGLEEKDRLDLDAMRDALGLPYQAQTALAQDSLTLPTIPGLQEQLPTAPQV